MDASTGVTALSSPQAPSTHTSPLGHFFPQVPQLEVSVARSVQTPLQSVQPPPLELELELALDVVLLPLPELLPLRLVLEPLLLLLVPPSGVGGAVCEQEREPIERSPRASAKGAEISRPLTLPSPPPGEGVPELRGVLRRRLRRERPRPRPTKSTGNAPGAPAEPQLQPLFPVVALLPLEPELLPPDEPELRVALVLLELLLDPLPVPLLPLLPLAAVPLPDELLFPVSTPPSRALSTHCPPTHAMRPGHWMPLHGLSTQTPPEQTWPWAQPTPAQGSVAQPPSRQAFPEGQLPPHGVASQLPFTSQISPLGQVTKAQAWMQ
jgi:hypothetical protein